MQLKTLLFNRGIYTQNFRNVGWIGIAYLLCLLFALPLQVLMITSNDEELYNVHYLLSAESLFQFSNEFQIILMFTVPVILAIFLFRFLHVKLAADYIHSLPLKREALFQQNIIFGILILVLPVIITGVSLFILSGIVDAPQILNVPFISQWVGMTILFNIFVFMASVFVAMFTGISVFQGVLTYILFLFPFGVTWLSFVNVSYFVHGFAVDYYFKNKISDLIPFNLATNLYNRTLSGKEIAILFLLIVGFYLVALLAYKKRNIETASQPIAFRTFQPVFLYGVTFCTMMLGGMYFGETQGTLGWRIFGYLTASIIGYFVALMFLTKSWRVLTRWKGYSIFVGVMSVIALLFTFDITGYEKRIPAVEEIERVYFAEGFYMLDEFREQENKAKEHLIYQQNEYEEQHAYYQVQENIENIRKIHEQIVKNKADFEQFPPFYRNVVFAYELANGKKLVRQYRVPEEFYSQPNEPFGALLESKEYKWNHYGILRLNDGAKINKITLQSHQGTKQLTLTNPEVIESFHRTLQTEFNEETSEEILNNPGEWAQIEYLLNENQFIYSSWSKSYSKIESWLVERGLLNQARLTAEDIAYAIIVKENTKSYYEYTRNNKAEMYFENRADSLRIEDQEQIEACLKASKWDDRDEYIIAYYLTKGQREPIIETINAKQVPSMIKKKLE